ncbi:MAG: ABC transporter permease [Bacteroidia bacterium]
MNKSSHNSAQAGSTLFQKGRGIWFAITWLGLVVFASVFAGVLAHPQTGLLVPYGPETTLGQKNIPPFGGNSHYLGTDQSGHDILASLIHGARVSLTVGLAAVGLAAVIGIVVGLMAGYWGDRRFRMRRGTALSVIPGAFFGWFYGFRLMRFEMMDAATESMGAFVGMWLQGVIIAAIIVVFWVWLGKMLSRGKWMGGIIYFPVDSLIMRIIEVLNSLPLLLVIISLSAIFHGSLWLIVIVIGLTGWTGLARLIRAETLRISEMGYVESGRALGLGEWRIIFTHILPNALPPALIVIAFGIGNAILAESALSFLHLVDGTVTWGSLLSGTRSNFSAWWVGVFPGMAIFLTVLSFNLIGEKLRDIFDPHHVG